MQRPAAERKDSTRETIVDKVFVEKIFFSDGLEKTEGPEKNVPAFSENLDPCASGHVSGSASARAIGGYSGRASRSCGSSGTYFVVKLKMEWFLLERTGLRTGSARKIASKPSSGAVSKRKETVHERKQESVVVLDDGLQARKALFQQVVASWHSEEKCVIFPRSLCRTF